MAREKFSIPISILIIIILIFINVNLYSQNSSNDTIKPNNNNSDPGHNGAGGGLSDIPIYIDDKIPPSPQAATFENYSKQVGVLLNTGTPTLSIPIYTLSNNSYTHPISISYSSNGIDLDNAKNYGSIGIDWSLCAGGGN